MYMCVYEKYKTVSGDGYQNKNKYPDHQKKTSPAKLDQFSEIFQNHQQNLVELYKKTSCSLNSTRSP